MRNDVECTKRTDWDKNRDVSTRKIQTRFYHFLQQTFLAFSLAGTCLNPLSAQADALPDEDPPVPVDQTVVSSLKPDQILVYVRGMVCGMCVQGITKLLTKLTGVNTVEINLETGAVLIRVSEKEPPTNPQIEEAIKGAGYEAQDIFRSQPSPKEANPNPSSPNTKEKQAAKKIDDEKMAPANEKRLTEKSATEN